MRNSDVDINPPLELCPLLPDNYEINRDEAEVRQGPDVSTTADPFWIQNTNTTFGAEARTVNNCSTW